VRPAGGARERVASCFFFRRFRVVQRGQRSGRRDRPEPRLLLAPWLRLELRLLLAAWLRLELRLLLAAWLRLEPRLLLAPWLRRVPRSLRELR
jgi:hypothetical protein